jgi:L-lactate permease
MVGWKKTMGVLPAALVAGGSYAVTCFLVSRFVGVELPAILSSFASLACLGVFLKFWKPKSTFRFPNDPDVATETVKKYTTGQIIKAWSPFVVLMIVMGIWSIPAFKAWNLKVTHLVVNIPSWPFLHGIVYKTAPIVAKPSIYPAGYRWEFCNTAGTALFVSSLISMVLLRISPVTGAKVFVKTLKQMKFAFVTLACVIGIAFVANYSGWSLPSLVGLGYS